MIDYPLSPIALGGFRILAFAVHFEDERSANPEADRNVSIEFNVNSTQEKSESDARRCLCTLSLSCTIATAEEEDVESSHLGTISAKFSGFAAGRFDPAEPENVIHDTLEANAVSFLYGKARTYIELITAACPGGVVTLPAIMPTVKEQSKSDDEG